MMDNLRNAKLATVPTETFFSYHVAPNIPDLRAGIFSGVPRIEAESLLRAIGHPMNAIRKCRDLFSFPLVHGRRHYMVRIDKVRALLYYFWKNDSEYRERMNRILNTCDNDISNSLALTIYMIDRFSTIRHSRYINADMLAQIKSYEASLPESNSNHKNENTVTNYSEPNEFKRYTAENGTSIHNILKKMGPNGSYTINAMISQGLLKFSITPFKIKATDLGTKSGIFVPNENDVIVTKLGESYMYCLANISQEKSNNGKEQ